MEMDSLGSMGSAENPLSSIELRLAFSRSSKQESAFARSR